jgi:hypothetical protein
MTNGETVVLQPCRSRRSAPPYVFILYSHFACPQPAPPLLLSCHAFTSFFFLLSNTYVSTKPTTQNLTGSNFLRCPTARTDFVLHDQHGRRIHSNWYFQCVSVSVSVCVKISVCMYIVFFVCMYVCLFFFLSLSVSLPFFCLCSYHRL